MHMYMYVLIFTYVYTYMQVLYYLRAFEDSGPLVSMIIKICIDIRFFLFILAMAIFAFSQVRC